MNARPPHTAMQHPSPLQQIQRAKTAHLRWRAYAQALVSGYEIEEGQSPLEHTDCQFGHWYYGAGQELQHLDAFRAIEAPHQRLHATYKRIYQLVRSRHNPGWMRTIRRWFGASDAEELQHLMDELKACSEAMLKALETLEQLMAEPH